jgi:hypothetical protein
MLSPLGGKLPRSWHSSLDFPGMARKKLARLEELGEGTAMSGWSLACGQQLLEARPLAVPTGLARDLSQLALGDQRCVLGWEQQDVFLDGRRKLPENDDLADAGRRDVCQPR